MPMRKRLLLNEKKRMRKERRIDSLVQLYQMIHRGEEARLPPDVLSIEKLVAYHYPKLSEQTREKYAKLLYDALKQRSREK